MQVGIYRKMAVHAVGNVEFRTARRNSPNMADNAARGVRRAKLAIREDARREADAFILEISEEARLLAAQATYADIVADILEHPETALPSNPRRDYLQYELREAARLGKVSPLVYERDKDALFGVKCDYCNDRGCGLYCVETDDEFDCR